MISPTHTLLALALLSKSGKQEEAAEIMVFGDSSEPILESASYRNRNVAIFLGSIIPDLAIYLWAPYQSVVNGVSGEEMWRVLYFEAPMQNLIAWFNSIPIYGLLAVIGYAARGRTWGKLMLFFALAALIHMATDLPVHAEDAYRHFWPISNWRFYSPLSYWDNNHHAVWVSKIDTAIALASVAVLWQRFPSRWVKITLSITAGFYILILAAPFIFG